MPLPRTITVKISSEEAGYVTMSRVVRREIAIEELAERILSLTGKQTERFGEILGRGAVVSQGARFRWESIDFTAGELEGLLAGFPDPDPDRAFDPKLCSRTVLRGPHATIEIDRVAGARRRLFRRRSYWDELLPILTALDPLYRRYSYGEKADVYEAGIDFAVGEKLRAKAGLLAYSTLEEQIRRLDYDTADLYVPR